MSKMRIKILQSGTSASLQEQINNTLDKIHIADFLEIKYTESDKIMHAYIRYIEWE